MLRVLETNDPEEWVTISQAARRLALSERQVRRLVSKLPEADRKVSGVSPACVRLSALLDRRRPDMAATTSTNEPDMSPASVRPESGIEDRDGLLDQLRSENAFLRSRLEAADVEKAELRRLMLADKAELSELRQRLAISAGPESPAGAAGRPWWRFWRKETG